LEQVLERRKRKLEEVLERRSKHHRCTHGKMRIKKGGAWEGHRLKGGTAGGKNKKSMTSWESREMRKLTC